MVKDTIGMASGTYCRHGFYLAEFVSFSNE